MFGMCVLFVVVIFLGFLDRCFRLGYVLTDLIIYISFSVINRDIPLLIVWSPYFEIPQKWAVKVLKTSIILGNRRVTLGLTMEMKISVAFEIFMEYDIKDLY